MTIPLNALETFNRKEIWIRITGILFISLLFPLLGLEEVFQEGHFLELFIISVIRTSMLWHGSILIISYFLTRYQILKQAARIIILQVVSLTVLVVTVELAEIFAIEHLVGRPIDSQSKATYIILSLIITYMINAIYASVSFFIQWKTDLVRANALEQANLEARYETLRNQVNPHFLFNSLNTLLMMVSDNQAAAKYVESVSDFMRYMLNSRDKEAVLLRDELKMAREYIYIQQSRFGDKLVVDFDIPESCFHYAIPPLSLQMLLENAIKHNVVSKENKLFIHLYISDDNYLVVENNIQLKIDKETSTGVGLDNIRNRYIYLSGKEMIVKHDNEKFRVMLPLFEKSL